MLMDCKSFCDGVYIDDCHLRYLVAYLPCTYRQFLLFFFLVLPLTVSYHTDTKLLFSLHVLLDSLNEIRFLSRCRAPMSGQKILENSYSKLYHIRLVSNIQTVGMQATYLRKTSFLIVKPDLGVHSFRPALRFNPFGRMTGSFVAVGGSVFGAPFHQCALCAMCC